MVKSKATENGTGGEGSTSKAKNEVVRTVREDGIEFFTVAATGESGMSQSGLAIFCGVAETSIRRLVKKVEKAVRLQALQTDPDSVPETGFQFDSDLASCLKSLVGRDLRLECGASYKNSNILTDEACAAICEYYAFEAPQPTQKALQAVKGFLRIGIRSYIHAQTNWKAPTKIDREYLRSLILDKPRKWERHFSAEWIALIRENYWMEMVLAVYEWIYQCHCLLVLPTRYVDQVG